MSSDMLPLPQGRELPQHPKSSLSHSLTLTFAKEFQQFCALVWSWSSGELSSESGGKSSQKDKCNTLQHVVYLM